MEESREPIIQVDASPDVRAGVHSDVVTIATKGNVSRLDFVQTDAPGPNPGDLSAVLSARVFMDNVDILALRDLLVRHTSGWTVVEEPDGR